MDPASRNPRGAEPRAAGPAYRRARAIPPDAAAVQEVLAETGAEPPRRRLLPIAVGAVLAGILFSVSAPAPPEQGQRAGQTDAVQIPTSGETFGIPMSHPRLLLVDTTLRATTPDSRPAAASVKIAFAYSAVGDDLERAHTAIDAHWDAARTALAAWLAGHTRLDLFREPGQLRAGLAAALTPALFPDGEGRVVTASLQHVTLR